MKITAEPRSDQWNADDFIGGPRTFTIAGVKVGSAEQKYDIELVEGGGRAWRPPLTILRLLIGAWGDEAATWAGRRVTLYRDADVRFGPDAVGGIRVSHLSHLPGGKPLTLKLTSSRGHRTPYTVQPLADAPAAPSTAGASVEPTQAEVDACTDQAQLRAWYLSASPETKERIRARKAVLEAAPTSPVDATAEPPAEFWAQQDEPPAGVS